MTYFKDTDSATISDPFYYEKKKRLDLLSHQFAYELERQRLDQIILDDFKKKYGQFISYVRPLTIEDVGKKILKVVHCGSIRDRDLNTSYTRRIYLLTNVKTETNKCQIHHCEKFNCTKVCGKCKKVGYCSKECQVGDWGRHKKSCGIEKSIDNPCDILYVMQLVPDLVFGKTVEKLHPRYNYGWIVIDELPESIKAKIPEEVKFN